jgi:hypothetical protein
MIAIPSESSGRTSVDSNLRFILKIKEIETKSKLRRFGDSYTFLTLKFGNHSLTPSNGLGIAATRLNTNRCAFSSRKVFLLRP